MAKNNSPLNLYKNAVNCIYYAYYLLNYNTLPVTMLP